MTLTFGSFWCVVDKAVSKSKCNEKHISWKFSFQWHTLCTFLTKISTRDNQFSELTRLKRFSLGIDYIGILEHNIIRLLELKLIEGNELEMLSEKVFFQDWNEKRTKKKLKWWNAAFSRFQEPVPAFQLVTFHSAGAQDKFDTCLLIRMNWTRHMIIPNIRCNIHHFSMVSCQRMIRFKFSNKNAMLLSVDGHSCRHRKRIRQECRCRSSWITS